MTLKVQIINELEDLSDENLIAVLSFIRYLKEGLVEHEQQKIPRKKVGYFSDKKYIADGFDFDEDNELIAEEFTGGHYKDVLEVIKFFAEEKECDEPEETVDLCKAWEDCRAKGFADGELAVLARLVNNGNLTMREAAEELGKTVEQMTELIEALKRDSIAPEETVDVCKAWADQRAEGFADGESNLLAKLVNNGTITIQEAANALGKTVEQATELFEALKKDSITKLVEDLKRAEERADKEGWLMAEEVRRSVE